MTDPFPPIPRWNEGAEQSVVGALLLDETLYAEVAAITQASDFFHGANRAIFAAIGKMISDGEPVDPVTLQDYLVKTDELKDVGGGRYLAALIDTVPTTANATAYARKVRDCATARRLAERAGHLAIQAGDRSIHVGKLLSSAADLAEMIEAETATRSSGWFPLAEASVARALSERPIPPPMLLSNFLPAGIPAMLAAPGGTGKSYLLLMLGVSIATGMPFLGKHQVEKPGSSLMIFAEENQSNLDNRVHSVAHWMLDPLPNADDLLGLVAARLFAKSMFGEPCLVTTKNGNECQQTPIVGQLIATAKQIPDLRLIALDPAAQFRGGEENASEDATRFVQAISKISKETGATVLMSHHVHKGSMAQNGQEISQADARGSVAFTDNVRWTSVVRPMTQQEATKYGINKAQRINYIQFGTPKSSYTTPIPSLWLLRQQSGGFVPVDLESSEKMQRAAQSDSAILAKAAQTILTMAKIGVEYSVRGFAEKYHEELSMGMNALVGLLNNALADGVVQSVKPQKPIRNTPQVMAVEGCPGWRTDGA